MRSTVLAGVAALTMGGAPVFAQEAEQTSEQEEQAEASDDRVVITGSRLRRNEFTSSSPIQVINAETAALQGMVDTAELIQGSSVAAGSVQFTTSSAASSSKAAPASTPCLCVALAPSVRWCC